jgi:hypothetical protein
VKNPAIRWLTAGVALTLLAGTAPARAEHFDIFMTVRGTQGAAESGWDTDPPEGGLHDRQVLNAKVGEDLTLEWRLRSEFPHGTMKNVGIRIWIAQEDTLNQRPLPGPKVPRVVNNSFTADFLPKHAGRGVTHFRVMKPGNYLVRLQSENTTKEHGHEHFAALDLKVE